MDKQLIEEFNRIYFSKNAITKRIYNIDDVNEIWEEIEKIRRDNAINTKLENKSKSNFIWYNVCPKIENLNRDIEDIITNDISKYIPKRYTDKLKKDNKLKEYEDIIHLNNFINESDFNNLVLTCDYKCKNNGFNDILSTIANADDNIKNTFRQLNNYILEINSPTLVKAATIYYYIVNKDFQNAELIARLTTYYYLKQNGYNSMYYQSIFKEFDNDMRRYNKAINESLDSDNDATYFIIYFLEVLSKIVMTLNSEISTKFGKKIIMDIIEVNNIEILSRQIDFVLNNIDKKKSVFTIADYKDYTKVVYETARTDLNNLITLGFFKISKSGKKFLYHLNDLGTIIDNLLY